MTAADSRRTGPSVPSRRARPAPLVLVGHGSRDPRFAATLAALADRVRRRRPDLDARLGFLELSGPSLEDVLVGVGDRPSVVVPLLLGVGYHARTDLPRRAAAATAGAAAMAGAPDAPAAIVTRPLGPDRRLDGVVAGRARELMRRHPTVDTFLLVATGSSDVTLNSEVTAVASRLGGALRRQARPAYATTGGPTVTKALDALAEQGVERQRIGVVPWFLAPGVLLDRAVDEAASWGVQAVGRPLADDELVAAVVLERYAEGSRARAELGPGWRWAPDVVSALATA